MALMPVMMGVMAAGTAVSAISNIRQGQVSGDTAMLNAKLRARELVGQAQMMEREAVKADYAAVEEREATEFEVGRQQEQARAFKSQQRADVAGSGLESTGSPLLVMQETARQFELDKLAIEHAGESRAREAEDEARMARYQAGELRKGIPLTMEIGRYQAKAARQAGYLGATRSILAGGASGVTAFYGARG